MNVSTPPIVAALVLSISMLAVAPTARAQDIAIEGDSMTIQFDEIEGTPLDEFIKYCQLHTDLQLNYNAIDTKDVRLKFIGRKKIKKDQFWKYFQSVLKAYDFVVVPYGNVASPNAKDFVGPDTGYYAVRKSSGSAATARQGYIKTQAPVVSPEELDAFKYDTGIVLTTSFALRYVNAQEATNTLQAYFTDPQLESVRAVTNSNTLVMTGFAQTLAQMQRLIALLDVEPEEYKPQFGKFELKFAVAEEIKPIVDQLIAAERGEATGGRAGGVQAAAASNLPPSLQEPAPHVEADARTNSLFVIAAEKSLESIGKYIRLLDVDVDPRGDSHVYRLKNSAAKDLEEILNEWAQNSAGGGRSGGGAAPGGAATATSGGTSSLEQPVTVVADEASNSLVITASKSRYAQVLEVIKRLDVRRRQVLIETALVEISGTDNAQLGVELGFTDLQFGDSDDGGFGLSNFGLSELQDLDGDGIADRRIPLGLGPGLSGAPGATGITAGILAGDDFQVPIVLKALEATTDTNVLSMPSVLVNDNEKAQIKTKDEQPTFTASQSTVTTQTSFNEYIEAGIQLDISPSISAGNYLRLTMKLEVSAFLAGNPGDPPPPPRTTRLMETAVTLPDGHTMVIGGIVQDDQRGSSNGIPWLKDIPLLGWLFGTSGETDTRTNLYLFVTPHIVSDDFATLDDLSYRKKREMELLNGKIYLVDEDWDRNNADTRILDAGVAGVFDMPAYASPQAGEQGSINSQTPPKPEPPYGEIEVLPDSPPPSEKPQQGKPNP